MHTTNINTQQHITTLLLKRRKLMNIIFITIGFLIFLIYGSLFYVPILIKSQHFFILTFISIVILACTASLVSNISKAKDIVGEMLMPKSEYANYYKPSSCSISYDNKDDSKLMVTCDVSNISSMEQRYLPVSNFVMTVTKPNGKKKNIKFKIEIIRFVNSTENKITVELFELDNHTKFKAYTVFVPMENVVFNNRRSVS